MVMKRDGIAGMGLEIMGKRYADPVRHPIGDATAPGTDPNAALLAAINALGAKIDALGPGKGSGSGSAPGSIPAAGQAVQFVTVDL